MFLTKDITANIQYNEDGFACKDSIIFEINKQKNHFLDQINNQPLIEVDEFDFLEESSNLELFEDLK